jgi:hypothetical protein
MFELDPATDLLICFALGLGALVVGFLAFFFERRRNRTATWGLPLSLGLFLAAPAVGLSATGKESSTFLPLSLLASFLVLVAFARTPLLEAMSRRLAGLLRRARVAPACLAVLGLGLIGWQILAIDRKLSADIDMGESALRKTIFPGLEPIPGWIAHTDKGREVQLMRLAHDPKGDAEDEATYVRSLGLDFQVIRTAPGDDSYNCHGWVFVESRAWVSGESVDAILHDNGYQTVSKPGVGDVVIFRGPDAKVSHTALVRAITDDGRVILESKWGKMGRYLHPLDQHAYTHHQASFYHVRRAGHQLRGAKAETERVAAK